jgi:hypothetical protein
MGLAAKSVRCFQAIGYAGIGLHPSRLGRYSRYNTKLVTKVQSLDLLPRRCRRIAPALNDRAHSDARPNCSHDGNERQGAGV